MAGYGATLRASAELDLLLRTLLRAGQRRARALNLEMTYRSSRQGNQTNWDVWVDGSGYLIAAWSQWIERELPIVAEGFAEKPSGRRAVYAALSLVARWMGLCVGDEERVLITTNGSDLVGWFWPVIDVPNASHRLAARLTLSDKIIARWLVGDLPEETAIEELHTAMEGLFRSLLGSRKGNWPSLLDRAEKAGYIASTQSATLNTFNAIYRNRLKHEAETLTDSERERAREAMYDVIGIADAVLSRGDSTA